MTADILPKPQFRLNWVVLRETAKNVGLGAFLFAAGGWVVSIRDQAASLPYRERATATLETIHNQVGANPVAQIKCQTHRGDVAEKVAVQAFVSNLSGDNAVPNLAVIPDCPAPKPAPSHSVRK